MHAGHAVPWDVAEEGVPSGLQIDVERPVTASEDPRSREVRSVCALLDRQVVRHGRLVGEDDLHVTGAGMQNGMHESQAPAWIRRLPDDGSRFVRAGRRSSGRGAGPAARDDQRAESRDERPSPERPDP